MKTPVQITFHQVPRQEFAETIIREAAEGLDQFFDDILGCRVVVDAPHRRQHTGNIYKVRVDVSVPGAELVVNREPGNREAHRDLIVAINDAFRVIERKLEHYAQERRGEVKQDSAPPRAVVAELFPEDGYGFLETYDGHSIYFHKNSVLNGAFNRLRVGTEVRFAEEEGEKGPQASTIEIGGR